jgi:hypothetical protein
VVSRVDADVESDDALDVEAEAEDEVSVPAEEEPAEEDDPVLSVAAEDVLPGSWLESLLTPEVVAVPVAVEEVTLLMDWYVSVLVAEEAVPVS